MVRVAEVTSGLTMNVMDGCVQVETWTRALQLRISREIHSPNIQC
jgi:hypothetical protein